MGYLTSTQIRHLSYKGLRSWYAGLVKPKLQGAPFNHIVQIGDPTLRAVSSEIPRESIKSNEVKFLITRMKQVMKNYDCVGLAAPQIGVPLRLFLMEVNEKHLKAFTPQERDSKEMSAVPFRVMVNPNLKVTDFTKLTYPEHCESVRGFHADVPRYRRVTLTALDHEGTPFEMHLSGWPARIAQHEMDHLNGQVYTDVMDRKSLACSCWQAVNERGGKVELPFSAD